MKVKKVEFKNNILSLSFDNIVNKIWIKDRKSKKIVFEKKFDEGLLFLELNVCDLNLEMKSNKVFYDFYGDGLDKEKRIRLYDKKANINSRLRFPFEHSNGSVTCIPYIAKDGFLCIMTNKLTSIIRESRVNLSNQTKEIVALSSCLKEKKIVLSLLNRSKNLNEVYFLVDENNKEVLIDYKKVFQENESSYYELDVTNVPPIIGKYKLKVITYTNYFFFEQTIKIENKKESAFSTLYDGVGQIVELFTNGDGDICLEIATPLSNSVKKTNETGGIYVNEVEISKNVIRLIGDFSDFENLSTKLWLINENRAINLKFNIIENQIYILDIEEVLKFIEVANCAALRLEVFTNDLSSLVSVSPISNWNVKNKILIQEEFYIVLDNNCIKVAKMYEDEPDTHILTLESNINISNLNNSFSNGLEFDLLPEDFYDDICFFAIERENKNCIPIEFKKLSKNRFRLSIDQIIEQLSFQKERYDIYANIVYKNIEYYSVTGPLQLCASEVAEKWNRYFYDIPCPEDKKSFLNRRNHFMMFLSKKNQLSFVVRDMLFIYNEKYSFKSILSDVSINKNKLQINFEFIFNEDFKVLEKNVCLILRSKVEEQIIDMEILSIDKKDGKYSITSILDLSNFDFQQFYYDVYFVSEINNDLTFCRITNRSKVLKEKINNDIKKNNYFLEDNVLYPYITDRNVLFIAYRHRDVSESQKDISNELLAMRLYKRFKYQLDAEKIWLVYEKESETAQDNSFFFFKYCYENQKNKKVFYVIKKDSPDRENLKGMEDRVVLFMSVKHLLLLQAAQLLVASETRGHAYLWRQQKGKIKDILNKKPFVFLQHGVTAFKLNDSVLRKDSPTAVNLYVTTSNFERDIIKSGLGYDYEDIIVTGFPRWDVLEDKSDTVENKQILIMPTWRSWLDEIPLEDFIKTDYYQAYMSLLQSDELKNIIEVNNIKIKFLLHPKFKQYIQEFKINSDRIELIEFGQERVNDLLMDSKMLITDYSSVAWEMYYMSKPVLFFQFDYEKYMELTGSYIRMEDIIFGDRTGETNELISFISDYVSNNFAEKDKFRSDRSRFFSYIDNNNSKRVYEGILSSKFYEKLNKKRYNNTPLPNKMKKSILKLIGIIK